MHPSSEKLSPQLTEAEAGADVVETIPPEAAAAAQISIADDRTAAAAFRPKIIYIASPRKTVLGHFMPVEDRIYRTPVLRRTIIVIFINGEREATARSLLFNDRDVYRLAFSEVPGAAISLRVMIQSERSESRREMTPAARRRRRAGASQGLFL